ncbi:MAG: hypothetical protein AB1831_09670 [Pseudomonadota bacterium]
MHKNVIILTGGLAGSSVLTSLLNKAGYWVGDQTMQKIDYNTWENAELVRLNNKILEETGFTDDWVMQFSPDYIDKVAAGFDRLDPAPFQAFVDECNRHQPWIWKDPRLWLTIRYWKRFLDRENVSFLTIRREKIQSWISTTLRRQIQSIKHSHYYDSGIHETIQSFLREEGFGSVDVLYEDLLLRPERVIAEINASIGTELTLDDFKSVFRGVLYKKQHGMGNFLRALAIYLKNYPERHG